MTTAKAVYTSTDNGQIACDEHRVRYGRIPWRPMSAVEQAAFREELDDVIKPGEPLCEVCRFSARRAKVGAAR